MPSDLFVGENMAWINFPTILIDIRAVDTRRAAPRLQVQTDAGQIGEFIGAPWTFDVLSDMYG